MNIYKQIRDNIIDALCDMKKSGDLPDEISFDAVTAEPPRDSSHGDIATNAAMVVAKKAGKSPRDIATTLAKKLKNVTAIVSAEIAGPGFINLRLENSVWHSVISDALSSQNSFGNSNIGKGELINIEYVSANPTGPMHIGHARGAVVGDVLATLMQKVGYNVTKEYYINDAGNQIENLARSAHLRYKEAMGEDIGDIPEGLYPGEYLKVIGESFAHTYGKKYLYSHDTEVLPVLRQFTLESMMELIKSDLLELGIQHDVFTSEQNIVDNGGVEAGLKILSDAELIYEGVLEPPKGKKPDDWESREQTLFRSTDFGDDVDRPIKKSDGSFTYFASDIAYHHDKLQRGFKNMTLILGADHGGYVKRLKAAVAALSSSLYDEKSNIEVILYQLVNFMQGGKPMKMSKRAGTYITVRDVVDAVGRDVIRFIMLTRKNDAVLDFDLEKVTEQSKDNPVFYVQYAHARIHSVLRMIAADMKDVSANNIDIDKLKRLDNPHELALIRQIAQWPRVVEGAAISQEPHRIAFYLQELASSFHSLWNMGNDNPSLRFIMKDDAELTTARAMMIQACAITIASGLTVMGVDPVMRM